MNKNRFLGVSFALLLLYSCNNSKKSTTPENQVTDSHLDGIKNTKEGVTLSNIIEGQWRTKGSEGNVPHWREFDPSNNTFRTWSHNGPRLSKPDGFYEVIGDTAVLLTSKDFEAPHKYGLDSLSEDYLEMWYYGVSASNLVYQRAKYEEIHLKDISKDTIAVEGTIIKAEDLGWAYTYGLQIDIGTDTLFVNYFTQKYSENSLRNKQVSLRYFNSIAYKYPNSKNEAQVFEITGIYNILNYGGDIPGRYSITDKNGRSIAFDSFLDEEDRKNEGTEVTELYTEAYKINIASLEVKEPIMNSLVFGDWNIVSTDAIPIGHRQIKIRPGGEKGVYIDFGGQGDNYVKTDISSNSIEGTNASGKFKLEFFPGNPILLNYTDDGNGGHYNPIVNQEYKKQESDFRQLLIGKWQGINDTEGSIEFTEKEFVMGTRNPYVLSSVLMDEEMQERVAPLSTGKVVYISVLDDGESSRSYEILKLDEDNLSYIYKGTANEFHFKRVK